MDKISYFREALKSEAFKYKEWVISLLSVVDDENSLTVGETFDYKVKYTKEGTFYTVGDNQYLITDAEVFEPLFYAKEKINLNKGDILNLQSDIETTIGRAIFNKLVLEYAFGNKIDYINERVNGSKLGDKVASLMEDYPEDGNRRPDKIYVDEFLRFTEAMGAVAGFTQLCVPSATPKSLTVNPEIIKERDRLLEVHKDQLNDPAVVAEIEKKLVDMDKEDMKDDPSSGFLISKKSYDITRKKMFILHGLEGGFGGPNEMTFIPTSLNEGWDIGNLPAMADSMRYGSYNRGALTALGGVFVKDFYRLFQNTRVAEDDCGSVNGLHWNITEDNYNSFVGLYEVKSPNAPMTTEYLKSKLNTSLYIRSPIYCKTSEANYCAKCMGSLIAENPNALMSRASEIGSIFMSVFMAKAHATALKTERVNLSEILS